MKRYKKYIVRTGLALGAVIVLFTVAFFALVELTPIDLSKLTATPQPTIVYDRYGSVYMKIGTSVPTDLNYNQLPKNLVNAVVATEDHSYWSSPSIDLIGILRATFVDLLSGSATEGASTIQEQLAKIVYLNDDKTLSYKIHEILLGAKLNQYFTKQEILAMYLNKVYLGENTVGVEQAALRYFGVNLARGQTLTLDQAALLAGLPQAPSAYDPILHPQAALRRRNIVLQNMVKYGYITQQQASAAEKQPLDVKYHALPADSWNTHPLFTNFLFDYAERHGITPQQLLQGGLKVYTTVDPKVQQAIHTVFWSKNYNGDFPGPTSGTVVEGAAVFVDPKTGGILGAAGSREQGFSKLGLDRVYTDSSPGSSIKPIMEYAPAIQSGKWTPTSILDNQPHDFGGGYIPQNWNSSTAPNKVTLQYALQWSQNVASVWLLQQIGINTGADFAERDGIRLTNQDRQHLGIAIGGMTYGVSPIEMAQAYEPFDNNGVQVQVHLITDIINEDGQVIYKYSPTTKVVMSPHTAEVMTRLMQDVVDFGTGQAAKVANWGVAGKTGPYSTARVCTKTIRIGYVMPGLMGTHRISSGGSLYWL